MMHVFDLLPDDDEADAEPGRRTRTYRVTFHDPPDSADDTVTLHDETLGDCTLKRGSKGYRKAWKAVRQLADARYADSE